MSRIFATFKFTATSINGKILEFPQLFYLRCDLAVPLGMDIVRQYNGEECIVARKVFQVMYDGQLLGTNQYTTLDGYLVYINGACNTAKECKLVYNGCSLIYNNCFLKYQRVG